MGFSKLRVFPITSQGLDGYPVYGPAVKLQNEANEVNAIEITFTPIKKSRTLSADDREIEKEWDTRFEGVLKVYDCDLVAAKVIFGNIEDKNGNEVEVMNSPTKKACGLFFMARKSNDAQYQKYIYNVTFGTPTKTDATDSGESVATLEIPFKGQDLFVDGRQIRSVNVYQGKTGWVVGEPITMYKAVEEE